MTEKRDVTQEERLRKALRRAEMEYVKLALFTGTARDTHLHVEEDGHPSGPTVRDVLAWFKEVRTA